MRQLIRGLLFVIWLHGSVFATDVDAGLAQMSFKERIYLNHFFRRYISMSHLGYVVFFDQKPVALEAVDVKRCRSSFSATRAAKGWQVWKKYEHLFPHPNFIFCEEKQRNPNYFHLIVVNKGSMLRVVRENEAIFREVLDKMCHDLFHEPFSPELFVQNVEQFKFLMPLILGNDVLLGLLMGFGSDSAATREQARLGREKLGWTRVPQIPKKMIIYGKGGITHVKAFGILPVAWTGDPKSDQVQELAHTYEQQCIALRRMFRKKSCLKPVLEALCNPENDPPVTP
ncbi:MAG: hypothetical protein S4CHLAM81_05690 [Chlamydiales bacterium]|nr:hypothetical protein [Chlamydiales bacterium]MCH9635354.1 hypothetical protein [Chlamydiales bacterium]